MHCTFTRACVNEHKWLLPSDVSDTSLSFSKLGLSFGQITDRFHKQPAEFFRIFRALDSQRILIHLELGSLVHGVLALDNFRMLQTHPRVDVVEGLLIDLDTIFVLPLLLALRHFNELLGFLSNVVLELSNLLSSSSSVVIVSCNDLVRIKQFSRSVWVKSNLVPNHPSDTHV